MAQKLWKSMVCVGLTCLMVVTIALAQPPIEQYCSGDDVGIDPTIIGGNRPTEE